MQICQLTLRDLRTVLAHLALALKLARAARAEPHIASCLEDNAICIEHDAPQHALHSPLTS